MHKIIFLDKSAVAPQVNLSTPNFPHEWVEYDYTTRHQLVERAQDATIAITCGAPLPAEELAQLPSLKMISIAMTGTDHVDLDYCHKHNIQVSNVPAFSPNTVAEHAIGLLLSLRRNILSYHNLLNSDKWYGEDWQTNIFLDFEIKDLKDNRIGIVGTGQIGLTMGRLCAALGMEVVYYNQNKSIPNLAMVSFDELLASCDVISFHCPLTPSTKDMFKLEHMKRMKKGAVLINTARGGIINEHDLALALESSVLAGAAIDVVEQEPIRPNEPLLRLMDLPNFIMTPHVAWSSTQTMQGMMDGAINNINLFVQRTPINLV